MSRPASRPVASSTNPNLQVKVLDSVAGRILCIADIRGRLSSLNELAREVDARVIIHCGDFGFFENSSLDRINDRTLRHLVQYSPLIQSAQRTALLAPEVTSASLRSSIVNSPSPLLSEFPQLLSGSIKLSVPVYTVWGACEDVSVLEKFRTSQYEIPHLTILDEATTRCIDIGGVKLRMFGLGGALVPHKMFDNGEGQATIAGGQGTMWTTALQIGELVDTAQRCFDQSETRLLISHASPGREGLLAQLALVLKADLTISAGLHFRYATSYNEFSVQGDLDGFRHKLRSGKDAFDKVWENVKPQVDAVIDENQKMLLDKTLAVIERIPTTAQSSTAPGVSEDSAWKNCWNWNLCDAANGSLVLDIKNGRVGAELKSQGFNYLYRRTATPSTTAPTPKSNTTSLPPSKAITPAPPAPASQQGTDISTPVSTEPLSQSPVLQQNGDTNKDKQLTKKQQKREREKERRKEEKDRDRTEREADTSEKQDSNEAKPSTSSVNTPVDTEMQSPVETSGARTPTGTSRRRHPWTLFMKLPAPCQESEIREFFQGAKDGITSVKFPNQFGRSRVAFVEFGDEEAMKNGLSDHAEKLKDQVVNVTIADDRGDRHAERGGLRGRGRGGFAQRAAAQAGLVRNPSGSKRTENGDASKDS